MRTRSLLLPLASGLGIVLAASTVRGAILAGNLNVVQNNVGNQADGVAGTAFGYTQGNISYTSGNRGDFSIRFDGATGALDVSDGIMIVSVAENGRSNEGPAYVHTIPNNNAAAISSGLGYSSASTVGGANGYATATFIGPTAISSGVKAGDEWNVNQAVGYFKYSEFIGGLLTNPAGNNEAITAFRSSSPGLTVGSAETNTGNWKVFDSTASNGVYNVNLTGLNAPGSGLPASSQTGVLLVVGGKNEANHATSRANADGTFDIIIRSTDTAGIENDPAGFVYVPAGQEGVVAMGRVDGTGAVAEGTGSGNFSIQKGTTGRWLISTTGYDPSNSVLLISPEGDVNTVNGDNLYTYAYDAAAGGWVVLGQDLPGSGPTNIIKNPNPQNVGTEPAFSFVLVSNQIPEPGTALLGALAGVVVLARRRRD